MKLNDFFTNEELENKYKKLVDDEIRDQFDAFDFDKLNEEVCSEFINDVLAKENPDIVILDTVHKFTFEWLNEHVDDEFLKEIIKEAMVEKLKNFSFEQVKELFNKIGKLV